MRAMTEVKPKNVLRAVGCLKPRTFMRATRRLKPKAEARVTKGVETQQHHASHENIKLQDCNTSQLRTLRRLKCE